MLPLYVTSGEPAGIGPDICLSLADRIDERPIVVLADIHMLKQRAEILNQQIELIEYQGQSDTSAQGQLYVEHVALNTEVVLGKLNAQNSAFTMILSAIETQDSSKVSTANDKLAEARKGIRDYQAKLKELADKYNVTIK